MLLWSLLYVYPLHAVIAVFSLRACTRGKSNRFVCLSSSLLSSLLLLTRKSPDLVLGICECCKHNQLVVNPQELGHAITVLTCLPIFKSTISVITTPFHFNEVQGGIWVIKGGLRQCRHPVMGRCLCPYAEIQDASFTD